MAEKQTEKMKELFAEQELSTEQLEEVAGGNRFETSDDSCFLNVLLRGRPGQCDRYGETRCGSAYEGESIKREVAAAWATVGIKFTVGKKYPYTPHYIDERGGRSIDRSTAYELAQQRVGKTLKKSDWYWS